MKRPSAARPITAPALRWLALAAAALAACGGGSPATGRFGASASFAARCATPRVGFDPATGQGYPDRPGSVDDEKRWVRAWTDELYLWYREVPAADPSKYATVVDYFDALKTQATINGKEKDRFHFFEDTATWERLSSSGVQAGYGVQWAILAQSPPRLVVVAYLDAPDDATAPATAAKLVRGTQVVSIDGAAVKDGAAEVLNAGLTPAAAGEVHTFELLDPGATATRSVQLRSTDVTGKPVQSVQRLPPTPDVGYMLFNDHLATAEKALIDAVTQLQGVNDLVVDMRYNGGGFLAIASELAYMIAGPSRTSRKTFERVVFNDKYPTNDPVTGAPLTPIPFLSTAQDIAQNGSAPAGQPLPTLSLGRVFLLTGPGTCSASESVINSLRGIGVDVVQIGATTCGKPYGFYPQDNCGTTYFSIEFKGENAAHFGDYPDGFTPGGSGAASPPGCAVADDFAHALGDPAEARLAAALYYRANGGSCPPASTASALRVAGGAAPDAGLVIPKPAWLENRILRR